MWKFSACVLLMLCSILHASENAVKTERIEPGSRGYVDLDGVTYFFSEEGGSVTWNQAVTACQISGMQLVTLRNQFKDNRILNYVLTLDPNFSWWTAGTRLANTLQWKWLIEGPFFTYNNWLPGQPQNDISQQGCMQITFDNATATQGWAEVACAADHYPYICEFEP